MRFCISEQLDNKLKLWVFMPTIYLTTLVVWSNVAAANSPTQIDKMTEKWLSIEAQTNKLQEDWKNQSPVLSQHVALLTAEKQQLQALLSQNQTSGNDVDIRRNELLKEQTDLEKQQNEVVQTISLLLYKIQNIAPLLPPTLKESWAEQSVVANDSNNTEKLQIALAQLTQLAEFEQRISVHEGTINTEQGKSILVQQFFLGASRAWFVSRDGQKSGWGQAGDEGWNWHFDDNQHSDTIRKAIDIFQKRQPARWINLPIHLTNKSPLNTNGEVR